MGQICRRDQHNSTVDLFSKDKICYDSISDRHDVDGNWVEKAEMVYSEQQTTDRRKTNARTLGLAYFCSG